MTLCHAYNCYIVTNLTGSWCEPVGHIFYWRFDDVHIIRFQLIHVLWQLTKGTIPLCVRGWGAINWGFRDASLENISGKVTLSKIHWRSGLRLVARRVLEKRTLAVRPESHWELHFVSQSFMLRSSFRIKWDRILNASQRFATYSNF